MFTSAEIRQLENLYEKENIFRPYIDKKHVSK